MPEGKDLGGGETPRSQKNYQKYHRQLELDPLEFQKYFEKHGRFTAGTAIQYYPSLISEQPIYQKLAPHDQTSPV